MTMEDLSLWFSDSIMHKWVIEQFWIFPLCETLHFIGLSFLFGALLVVDGRILGLCKFVNMQEAMKFIPVAIIGFAVNLITGYIFMTSDPNNYIYNLGFQWKMGLIALAGVNALWFWIGEHKELKKLADGQDAPFRAKVIAAISLLLWVGVIIGGRMIPYTDNL
jgi:hypothetical protein